MDLLDLVSFSSDAFVCFYTRVSSVSRFLDGSACRVVRIDNILESYSAFIVDSIFVLSPFATSFVTFYVSSYMELELDTDIFGNSNVFSR